MDSKKSDLVMGLLSLIGGASNEYSQNSPSSPNLIQKTIYGLVENFGIEKIDYINHASNVFIPICYAFGFQYGFLNKGIDDPNNSKNKNIAVLSVGLLCFGKEVLDAYSRNTNLDLPDIACTIAGLSAYKLLSTTSNSSEHLSKSSFLPSFAVPSNIVSNLQKIVEGIRDRFKSI